jgi:tetratricopeptide (TPR) repeat protein
MRRWLFAAAACAAVVHGVGFVRAETAPPANPYRDILVGRFAERMDDPAIAGERLGAAALLDPQERDLVQTAVRASLMSGDVARAAGLAATARAMNADSGWGRVAEAAEGLAQRRPQATRALLTDVNESPLETVAARLLLAWGHVDQRKIDRALVVFDEAGANSTGSIKLLIESQRALALSVAGKRKDAEAALRALTSGRSRFAPLFLEHAALLQRAGDTAGARAVLHAALKEIDNPELRLALARVEAGEKLQGVARNAQEGAAIGLFALGTQVLREPAAPEHTAIAALALHLRPDYAPARLAFAEGLRARGHESAMRDALALVPEASAYFALAQVQRAMSFRRDDRNAEAMATLERAAGRDTGETVRRGQADLLRALGRFEEAERIYTALIDARGEDKDWRLYYVRALTRQFQGRWPSARDDLQEARQLSADNPEVLNALGYGFVERGENLEEGMALIRRAVELRPNAGHIIDSLGWAYYQLGQYENAIEHLERAVVLEPGDSTINDHLGDAYWRAGRRIEARFQWRRALSLDPSPTEKAAIESKLTQGLAAR